MKALAWVAGALVAWVVFGLVARVLAEAFLLGWRLF